MADTADPAAIAPVPQPRRAVARHRAGIAFVTMVRDEDRFLRIWVEYYSRFVPRSALHILFDGLDQALPDWVEGCQALRLPHLGAFPGIDQARWSLVSAFVSALTEKYATVVFNDVDEIIALDPEHGDDLPAELARAEELGGVITPFGLEVIHRRDLEPEPLDWARPVLGQRRHVRINTFYSKPCVTSVPIRWSTGGHYADHPVLSLSDRLVLFHLRLCDEQSLLQRQSRRRAFVTERDGQAVAGGHWRAEDDDVLALLARCEASGEPLDSDFRFSRPRRVLARSWHHADRKGVWRVHKLRQKRTFTIPERFFGLF